MRKFTLVLLFLTLIALLTACGFQARVEGGDLVAELNLALPENRLNFDELTVAGDVLMRNVTTDIRDGEAVLDGEIRCPDGTVEPGSVTMTLAAAENGTLEAEIVNVDSTCLSLEDPVIQQANAEMARAFAEIAQQNTEADGELTFTTVDLSDDTLNLGVQVRAPLNN